MREAGRETCRSDLLAHLENKNISDKGHLPIEGFIGADIQTVSCHDILSRATNVRELELAVLVRSKLG